jgi:hypothetical protein
MANKTAPAHRLFRPFLAGRNRQQISAQPAADGMKVTHRRRPNRRSGMSRHGNRVAVVLVRQNSRAVVPISVDLYASRSAG